jgi:hypothetical protein
MSAKHNLGSRRGWMWLVVPVVVLAALEMIGALLITHRLLPRWQRSLSRRSWSTGRWSRCSFFRLAVMGQG